MAQLTSFHSALKEQLQSGHVSASEFKARVNSSKKAVAANGQEERRGRGRGFGKALFFFSRFLFPRAAPFQKSTARSC